MKMLSAFKTKFKNKTKNSKPVFYTLTTDLDSLKKNLTALIDRASQNKKLLMTYIHQLEQGNVFDTDMIDNVHDITCKINRDNNLRVLSIEDYIKKYPTDSKIYEVWFTDIHNAITQKHIWWNALDHALALNDANKKKTQAPIQYDIGGRRVRSIKVSNKHRNKMISAYRNKNLKGFKKKSTSKIH